MDNELCLKEIGERIRQCRKALGLTQEALAEKSEMTTQAISLFESGKRMMRFDSLLKLATALNTSTDYLLTGKTIDRDKLILSEKLDKLTPQQVKIIETIVDECISLYHQGP